MKKVIGIIPLWDEKKDSIWMLPGYLDGITEAGGLPIVFPLTSDEAEIQQLCDMCDGFLLTGGHDVGPSLYGEEPLPELGPLCEARDDMEKMVIDHAIAQDKAILGICRGIQYLNVALGGTLYQDIPTQCPSDVDHHMAAPYDRTAHMVTIEKSSQLFQLLGIEQLGVNSCHHQAIKDLAPSLQVMATAPDGLVEAVSMEGKRFIWAVQWHPEFSHLVDENSRKMFSKFLEMC